MDARTLAGLHRVVSFNYHYLILRPGLRHTNSPLHLATVDAMRRFQMIAILMLGQLARDELRLQRAEKARPPLG